MLARLEANSAFNSAWSRYSSAPWRKHAQDVLGIVRRPHRENAGLRRFAQDLDSGRATSGSRGRTTTIKSRSASLEPAKALGNRRHVDLVVAPIARREHLADLGHEGFLVADNEGSHHGTSLFETAIRTCVLRVRDVVRRESLPIRDGNPHRPASSPRSVRISA